MESKQYKQSLKNIQGTIGDKDVLSFTKLTSSFAVGFEQESCCKHEILACEGPD